MGNALHTPGAAGVGVVSPAEARLDDAGLIAAQGPTALDIRTGVLIGPGSTALVAATADTGPMTVSIAPHHWVTSRLASDGVYRGANEVARKVNIGAAPGAGTRIDVVYVKQGDAQSTITPDGATAPVYGVLAGVTGAGKPSLSAAGIVGAEEIATVAVSAGAVRTTDGTVLITNTARQTAARGAPIPVRSQAERDAYNAIAWPGLHVTRLDLGGIIQRWVTGTTWDSYVSAADLAEITAGPWETTTAAGTAAVTAETVIMTVNATGLTVGREYKIEFSGNLTGSVVDDRLYLAFRRTNLAGTQIDEFNSINAKASTAFGVLCTAYDIATATSMTWVLTLQRFGTGTTAMAARGGGVNRLRVTPVA